MAIVESGLGVTRRVGFAADLGRHGDAVAVVDVDGTACSYAELADRADRVADRLGPVRRLVLVEATNDLDRIVAYLGALRGGHVVLLVAPEDVRNAELIDTYSPDAVIGAGLAISQRAEGSVHDLHPDLALLLSTSGSTGSPKLVRLSHENLEANAAAIAEYLDLQPEDRAITSLPMQYCYGLSVLHSHLGVGAGIVCTPASVVDPCFWDAVDRHGVTNLAGVPHTFELLGRSDFAGRSHPSLRLLTQAGGRLDPADVLRWRNVGQERGFDLFVMYGQTEATARMAYLPPALAGQRPSAVGVAIPGGSFRLAPVEGAGPDEGELVYSGPNVMLGYAESPGDLALGRTVDDLRTGDLARIDADGVVDIVGRLRRFVKVFGLRLDVGRIEQQVREQGVDALCVGDDSGLAVAVLDGADRAAVRELVVDRTGLPPVAVAVAAVDQVPRLANGKIDRTGLLDVVRDRSQPAAGEEGLGSVAAALGRLLGVEPGPEDTFVSLGGDSLTYVEASIVLEERLGCLPPDWHLQPIGSLDDAPLGRRPRLARLETGVLLRAVAIVLVVGNHAGAFLIGGGAHVLFAVAGFNMARFQLSSGAWGRSVARVAVPSMIWIGGVAAVREDFDLAHALLLHGWIGGSGRWVYWFVEVLVQVLVVVAVAMRVPIVARFERRRPFLLPALLLVPALAVRFDVVELGRHHRPFFRPHEIAWIFILGWMAARARSPWQRALVSVAAVAAVPGFFADGLREAVLLAGFLALVWIPSVPVPKALPRLVAPLAGASLYIYLSHVQVHPLLSDRSPILGLLASLAVGVALWRAAQPVQRRIEGALARSRLSRPAAGSPGASPPRPPADRVRRR